MSMNKLSIAQRANILTMLCEGSSMRSVSRIADVSINTVAKLLVDAGNACEAFHDETVRNVGSKRVQCDEIWSFCYAKQKNLKTAKAAPEDAGDVWTWTALDADSKLIISYLVGDRKMAAGMSFVQDVAERVSGRIQLTTDGYGVYLKAVEEIFGADVDFAQLVKHYSEQYSAGRYSPPICTGATKTPVTGKPSDKHISTSYAERQNLTMRMHMRRFTRLTNGFSKKAESHADMVALYTVWYNFIRIHKTLKCSPAMAAGVSKTLLSMEDVVALIDARAAKPNRPAMYKKAVKADVQEENSN